VGREDFRGAANARQLKGTFSGAQISEGGTKCLLESSLSVISHKSRREAVQIACVIVMTIPSYVPTASHPGDKCEKSKDQSPPVKHGVPAEYP